MANDNRTLGRFQLTGIPPAPRGIPQIEVTFDIDANGILNVSAKDLGTGKEQSIVIKSSSGLSEREIQKMMKDAEDHADEDKNRRELVDAKNAADQILWNTDKTMKEHSDKVDPDDKRKIEEAMEALKKAKAGDSKEEIDRAVEELNQASHKLAQALYQEASARQAEQAGAASPPPEDAAAGDAGADAKETEKKEDDENVIDADFEVKD